MTRYRDSKWSYVSTFAGLALLAGLTASAAMAGTPWPGLRGPNHDGSVDAKLFEGDTASLEVAWKVDLGSGYSSVVVSGPRVVTLFADGDTDYIGAFDTESGKELWRYGFSETYPGHDGSHDGPISTPWVEGDKVYGLGPYGQLFALDVTTGKELWATDLSKDYEAPKPHYGFTSSPVVVGDVLVVQVGGGEGKSVAGFNVADGEMLWTLGDDAINYQSPVAVELAGQLQVLSAGPTTLIGIEPKSGELLWSYEHGGDPSAMGGSSLVPLPAGDDRIFLANKTDASSMVQVKKSGDGFEVSELWSNNTIRSSYVLPVVHDGYVYGISGRILTCVDAATGERKWRSRAPGDGFPTRVGDHLVIITKPGSLHVVDASPEGFNEVASVDLFEDHSWSAVAYADGHLYARSMAHLARIDVQGSAPEVVAEGDGEGDGSAAWIGGTAFGAFLAKVDGADDKKAAVDAFLEAQSSFPIIEPSGAVHFVYRGEAEDVGIVGDMIGYRREDPMNRVAGTDLFYYSMMLEPNAAVDYGFLPDFAGEPVADPRNEQKGAGLFGEVSWFAMPAYDHGDFLGEAEEARRGTLNDVEWESTVYEGKTVAVQVYLPAGYDDGEDRYPVAYVMDGKGALEQGSFQNALDNLIGDSVAPMIAVFVNPVGEPRRGPDPNFPKMILDELIPKIDETYRTRTDRMDRALVGAGGGAGPAFTMAFNHKDTFAKVGGHSMNLLDPTPLTSLVEPVTGHPMVLFQEWGTYHLRSPHEAWDMAESNRRIWADFRTKGYRPAGGEIPMGFGWQSWKSRIGVMLSALFPHAD